VKPATGVSASFFGGGKMGASKPDVEEPFSNEMGGVLERRKKA